MKTLKSIFIEEVQATQIAFQLIGRLGTQKLTTEEREVVKTQMIKVLLFMAFLVLPFGSLLLPFIFPSFPKPSFSYMGWAKKFIPTRGLR
jgi:hypothetical protein